MGLDANAIRFLLDAKRSGVSFERTITIGRQGFFVEPSAVTSLFAATLGAEETRQLETATRTGDGFCEPVLRALGAKQIESMDVSAYQQASIVHDLNLPIPTALHGQFTTVLDSGSLEHVFHFPQAIKNCMEMVAPGGHLLCVTIANNFLGHGFYQFSPELFYRVLHPTNGFVVERMMIYEEYWSRLRFFDVADPDVLKRRVTLANRFPTCLMIRARRTQALPIFKDIPQQSDYVAEWESHRDKTKPAAPPATEGGQSWHHGLQARLSSLVPTAVKDRYHDWKRGADSFHNKDFFRKADL